MHEWMERLRAHLSWRWYGWLVLLTAAVYQLHLPIAVLDTDMWYHLSDGRYFLEHGEWPYHTYFSFLEPAQQLLNHWWFYQPAVTLVFEQFGYLGLVVLRSAFFLLACYLVYRLLLDDDPRARTNAITFFVFALVVVILHHRGLQLRPYLLTYVFVAAFLFILERKPRLVWLLPLLSILWANSHGVGWPIAAVICGSYFVQWAWRHYRSGGDLDKRDASYGFALVLCGFGFMVNPIGIWLFLEPFLIAPDLSKFISEIKPLSPRVMTQFVAQFGSFGNLSAISVFTAVVAYATVNLLLRRQLRISHALLLIGGTILLFRAGRFLQIWMLLCLPMLRCFAQQYRWRIEWHWAPSVVAVTAISLWVLALPIYNFIDKTDRSRTYPFDWTTAPAGTVKLLERYGKGGNVLIVPGLAGYLEWYLPEYPVYADMRLNRYSYKAWTAFRSAEALRQYKTIYPIDFLIVPIGVTPILERIEEVGGFVPVFLDDKTMLFADEARQPELIEAYRLSALDIENPLEEIESEDEQAAAIVELQRLVDVYPEGYLPRFLLVKHLFDAARYEDAERHVDVLLEGFPENVNVLTYKGNILENTDRCNEALGYFETAIEFSSKSHRRNVLKHVGACHYLLQNHEEAYAALDEALNPYVRVEEPEYLYQYAFVAAYNGDIARAVRILELLLLTLDEEESPELKPKAVSFLDKLRGPEFGGVDQVSFVSRLLGTE